MARAVALLSIGAFLASAPFAREPLAPVPAFIPVYQSALVISDLTTAVLLFGQFSILQRFQIVRSTAVLVLAGAYLFTACLAAAHTLSFPGLFSSTGLFAGPQTTAWLYMFWHAGFPLCVIAYARIRSGGMTSLRRRFGRLSIAIAIAATLAAALACILLATALHDVLPPIMRGNRYTPAMIVVVTAVCALSALALAAVWRRRSQTVLDLWLMVVMLAWALDIGLSAVLNSGRFDLGFYAGRIYGLLATSFVLVMLLLESGRLYALLIETHQSERRKTAELQRLSALDPLTGIANRRAFENALDEEWRRSVRHRTPLCLIMIDVDCFKRFNDTYGHVAGDQCLRAVARVLAASARRAGEVVARYGGEEFAVLLPHTEGREAYLIARQICQGVRGLGLPHAQSTAASHVTISLGLAEALALIPAGEDQDEARAALGSRPSLLVERADAALYLAKSSGRNRVAWAGHDAPAPAPEQSAA
ncbi:MAG TPA: sensor domain-containing diguanylate cyclase [Hyphomicrobiaceae bacterium]|nr:sensor domain-containing diguanylate cyclase [Hyphomicrobiaceae bacterium]